MANKKDEQVVQSYSDWSASNNGSTTASNNTPVQPHDSSYQAVGAGSQTNAEKEQMKPEDQKALEAAGQRWTNATTQEERDAAHADAEAIRAKYGYYGGQDGSDRLDVVTGNKLDDSINNDSVNNGVKPSYANDYANNGAADKYGVGNNYAKEVDGGMTPTDYNKLTKYGEDYNMYAAQMEQALAKATNEDEERAIREIYEPYLKYCHAQAEAIRNKYGYSGGEDGSEYIPTGGGVLGSGGGGSNLQTGQTSKLPESTVVPDAPDLSGLKELPEATKIPDAPDFTSLLDQWLESAKQQQESKIDYAVQQGITELERAEQDAQEQFQTQRNQVDIDEARALDNQALYAERRGDKGGIGALQYATVQNTAMEQRRAVNQAQTKLATDTVRQIADLRYQGEFEKADALLELNQTYLSKLMELQQWNSEYNLQKAQVEESIRQWEAGYQLDVAQFEENIRQWQASFQESIRQWEAEYLESIRQWEAEFGLEVDKFNAGQSQWEKEFGLSEGSLTGNYKGNATLESQKLQNNNLAEAGWTMLKNGILPSSSQLAAMGVSTSQAQDYLTALKLAQSNKGSDSSGGVKVEDKEPDVSKHPLEWLEYNEISADQAEAVLRKQGYSEDYAYTLAKQYMEKTGVVDNQSDALQKQESNAKNYGSQYSYALAWAKQMKKNGKSAEEIEKALTSSYTSSMLNYAGIYQIMQIVAGG